MLWPRRPWGAGGVRGDGESPQEQGGPGGDRLPGTILRANRRALIPAAVISGLFALPIALNLVLHWPGDFGKYISYGGSGRAGGHGARQVVQYALWFWWPHQHAWLAPLLGYLVALAAVLGLTPGRLRGFLLALLAVNVVSSLAFLFYASVGIDNLDAYYIGYFYWSAPLITVLVVVPVVNVFYQALGH